jgi:hypothetical protein
MSTPFAPQPDPAPEKPAQAAPVSTPDKTDSKTTAVPAHKRPEVMDPLQKAFKALDKSGNGKQREKRRRCRGRAIGLFSLVPLRQNHQK